MIIYDYNTKRDIFLCNHVLCKEESWLGKGFDWKMCEIVFGVHTDIHTKLYKEAGKSVRLIRLAMHFCRLHATTYQDIIFSLIARRAKISMESYLMSQESNILGDAYLQEGFGCFITIHNCFTREPIKNMQMSYDVFEKVVSDFLPIIKHSGDIDFRFVEKINNLKQLRSTVNLSVK